MRIRLAAGLAAVGVLALAGCGQDEPKPIGPDEAAQAAAADEFADCLRRADLPVFVSTDPSGQKDVHVEGDEVVVISTSFDQGIAGGDYPSAAAQQAALAAAGELVKAYDPVQGAMMTGASEKELEALGGATDPEARYLIVGTTDQTEPYFECLDRTGYQPSTYSGDPADELKAKQRVAEATVKWAECARQNGYPDLKDPDAPTVGDDSWPAAVLPGDITAAELNRLLDNCPNYDVEGQLAFQEAMAALGDDPPEDEWERVWDEYYVDYPAIDFEVPAGSGASPQPDKAAMAHLEELRQVLNDRRQASEQSIPAPSAT